jgi:hypothetical protein
MIKNATIFLTFLLCVIWLPSAVDAQKTGKAKSRTVSATGKRVKTARMTSAAIKAISKDKRFERFVEVTGNSITAAEGYMLVKLSTGLIRVINDNKASSGATVKMQVSSRLITSLRLGTMVEIITCSCGGSGGSDACLFGRTAGGSQIITECGGASCCKNTCLRVDRYGNVYDCDSTTL